MGTKGREMDIWNSLTSVCDEEKQQQQQTQMPDNPSYTRDSRDNKSIDAENKNEYILNNDQQSVVSIDANTSNLDLEIQLKPPIEPFFKKTRVTKFYIFIKTIKYFTWLIAVLMSAKVIFGLCYNYGYFSNNHKVVDNIKMPCQNLSQQWAKPLQLDHGYSESFEITIEEEPSPSPVYTQNLLTYNFGNSWGKPAKFKVVPWDNTTAYNTIYLELKTFVNGTQYDRLLHVFINNITIWRSSTVEPFNRTDIHSRSVKDITKYIKLFKNNKELEMVFQLDNIVTAKLDGVFSVELNVNYYNLTKENYDEQTTESEKFLKDVLLDHVNPYSSPDFLEPLISTQRITPLLYYPHTQIQRPYSHSLKPFIESLDPKNTIKISAEVFLNGNAAEEFWYSNVLDKYAGRFSKQGHELLGHGPMRTLNVYLTTEPPNKSLKSDKGQNPRKLIHSVIPNPTIFTGGISPPLWKPVVSIGAFDLTPILIDLTPYMNELLFNSEKEWFLEFEIASSFDTDSYKETIGENWILSGNLMAWCGDTGKHPLKYLYEIDSNQNSMFKVKAKDDEPDELEQRVESNSSLLTVHRIQYKDTEYFLNTKFHNLLINTQVYKKYGDHQSNHILLVTGTEFEVIDTETDQIVFLGSDDSNWALETTINTIEVDESASELTYKSNISLNYKRNVSLLSCDSEDNVNLYNLQATQIGDSVYTLSPSSNYGSGNSIHSVEVDRTWPWQRKYNRVVIVKDNKAIVDVRT
ncbi:uncharacterized protein SCODWIG_02145 [Saccharomycodes ludwigii]|uniref:Peptide N-acetyl-beta-D-glucosaminyl asparaginase amidase A N-terminal domain-containing protein n=1 Tax=Saccharomycodes ludwigii TaxID=36035 RepID=A0A376B7C4_9ASCO|nr:uncharacterized protein SCODWIG_02145 [Saccharomycodes ludwigii]